MSDEPADSIDLACADRVRIGVTRGETARAIGPPRDYPDRADVSVGRDGDDRVNLSIDAMAGDHGTGHADIELTVDEARRLCDLLEAAVEREDDRET